MNMKHQKGIRQILKSLLKPNKRKDWLDEWEVVTSYCPKKIAFVKTYGVIVEVTSFSYNGERHNIYRLKETSKNIKRAKKLLKALA